MLAKIKPLRSSIIICRHIREFWPEILVIPDQRTKIFKGIEVIDFPVFTVSKKLIITCNAPDDIVLNCGGVYPFRLFKAIGWTALMNKYIISEGIV